MNESTAVKILKNHFIEAKRGTFQEYTYNQCSSWIMQIQDEDGRIALGWEETFVIWPLIAVPALVGEMLDLVEPSHLWRQKPDVAPPFPADEEAQA